MLKRCNWKCFGIIKPNFHNIMIHLLFEKFDAELFEKKFCFKALPYQWCIVFFSTICYRIGGPVFYKHLALSFVTMKKCNFKKKSCIKNCDFDLQANIA